MSTMFRPATRKKLKLRMAICAPAGYGKTYTALRLAYPLAAGGKIAVIDTEHGAASKCKGLIPDGFPWEFDVCELQHFAPSAYTTAIREAAAAGYSVLIIDSLSHAWAGVGGALAQVDAKAGNGGNSFTAWKDVTPQHNELVETILASPLHIIATMRTKMEYVLEEETRQNGRKVMVPKKVGMKPVQREGMDYEFDVVADMDESHTLKVGKTRCSAIDGQVVVKPGPEFMRPLLAWLDEGENPQEAAPTFTATGGNGNGSQGNGNGSSNATHVASTLPTAETATVADQNTKCSPQQRQEIIAIAKACGLDAANLKACVQAFGAQTIADLSFELAGRLQASLEAMKTEKEASQLFV